MKFNNYFLGLSLDQRKALACRVNASLGHLNNCAYGYVKLSAKLCVLIEKHSGGAINRVDLHDDPASIWPELVTANRKRKSAKSAA